MLEKIGQSMKKKERLKLASQPRWQLGWCVAYMVFIVAYSLPHLIVESSGNYLYKQNQSLYVYLVIF